jgi:hypothetical protein
MLVGAPVSNLDVGEMYSNRSCAWFSTGGLKTICIVDGNTGDVPYFCHVRRSCLIVLVFVFIW